MAATLLKETGANTDIRPRKRVKTSRENRPTKSQQPGIFAPFRALGLVTNHVPFALQTRSFKGATDGPRVHILTCLGRSWALWEGGKMGLLFVGPETETPITSILLDGDAVWASSGPHVIKYIRGREVARMTNPLGSTISDMLIFGGQLLGLSEDGNRMCVWNTEDGELQGSIEFSPGFTATTLLHPATYLNKVLVASSEGSMQLWNIRTQTLIHTFSASNMLTLPASVVHNPAAIASLTQSPAIDVVGVGFSSGEISVYDVRSDERLMRMFMDGAGPGGVRALSFRSDGEPILASASSSGHIALWDLNAGGRLLHVVRGAHDGAVTALEWIPGQPVLLSSGEDNSLKQWLFDSPTAPPRLLKFRSGHHAPPHLIRFYGDDGKQLLTAGRDRTLRCTSVVRDARSFEFSQGSLSKKATNLSIPLSSLKFSPVTSLSFSTTRSKDWDDVVTSHADETFARSWSVLNKRVGKHSFSTLPDDQARPKGPTGSVKAVCVSGCGNFSIIGSSTGAISMWNMQSGLKRKTFDVGPYPVGNSQTAAKKDKGNQRCITGLASDALNRVVVASTLDGTVNFFDFHTTKLETVLSLPTAAVSISLQRDSGLIAVVCDDLVVRVVDIETRKVVRELGGFRGRVLDVTFSPDSRWLITTSLDSVVRTFDVPTGRCIDAFRTSSIATSISFSPTGEFLATSHVDSVGVYLWANRAQFSEVSLRSAVEDEIPDVALPSVQDYTEDDALDGLRALTVTQDSTDVFMSPPQIGEELVTLTLLPRSRWQTLLNLEVIQQRNKPKEPPKAPEKAPFFLPTLPGVEHRFAIEKPEAAEKKPTRRLEKAAAQSESIFYKKLEAEDPEGIYEDLFTYAKTLSPAAVDLELRQLTSLDAIRQFLHALIRRLRSHRDFEAVQTLQNVFLRMHGDVIIANAELLDTLAELRSVQRRESERILELIECSAGTLGFVRDTM
ncbi:Utp21-domain-containing protein [Punctularia strigosozonata HHB-11173 SS5]|uniref:Utp21-domain-containing protein n=1 Tax=Punctularia strigosozonata (strain HHB-11173) TaxID=741275 RepID=UPI0004418267|nr:Utp21-domain-containing protein [Punctularia strigosozonata HHB-11173 SS5]EIN07245.1 Utp21-domain-containing protein [Punctularia strigosozonata HHB-11173 SS5]